MKNSLYSLICKLIFCGIFASATFTNIYAAHDYGIERLRTCKNDGSVEDFQFLDFGAKETEFNLGNPYCAAYAIGVYTTVKAAIVSMNIACKSGPPYPRFIPTPLEDLKDIAMAGKAALKELSENHGRPGKCFGAHSNATIAFNSAMGGFAILLGVAKHYYDSVSVCGDNWHKPNPQTFLNDGDGEMKKVNKQIESWIKEADNQGSSNLKLDSNDPTYREWVYGGVEFESDRCFDTTKNKNKGEYPKQKYYFRGLQTANYRCEIYNPFYCQGSKKEDCRKAYECCLDTSQNYICLNKNNSGHIFCKAGSTCDIDKIQNASIGIAKFEAYFRDNKRLICAKSYSLCPYNFSVGGGTTFAEYMKDGVYENGALNQYMPDNVESIDMYSVKPQKVTKTTKAACDPTKSEVRNADCTFNNKAGRIKNYCQFYRHCTVAPEKPYVPDFSNFNPYFSRACLDFKGDAKNGLSFSNIPQLGKLMNFSAPLAQCFKETLENVFFNRYGYSLCADGSIANDDVCSIELLGSAGDSKISNYMRVGNIDFKKGNQVEVQSFFSRLQDQMRLIVKWVLTISVSLFGFNLLIGKVNFEKGFENRKEILVYLLKIAMVTYFALGDAWQSKFFDGVYGASTKLAEVIFKVRVDDDPKKQDGCQFGSVFKQDGSSLATVYQYPKGKEYLMIFDTLDCKIMKFLGYGPSSSSASIAMLIMASFFTGGIGLYFALSILIFAMLFIALTIRAIQLFISVGLAIIIYVFVSPIIIPLALFEKTKNIFEGWLKHLIGFCFQPIILFAYLGIFITLSEQAMVGTARYIKSDNASYTKQLDCSKYCGKADGTQTKCRQGQAPNINPYDSSMACILNFNEFGKNPGFEMFGIGITVASKLFENIEVRLLLVLKCALLMFILAKFMDEIPEITTQLISSALPSSESGSKAMLDKTVGIVRGAQKRLARLAKAQVMKGAGALGNAARNSWPNYGKQSQPESGSNIVGNSSDQNSGNILGSQSSQAGNISGNQSSQAGNISGNQSSQAGNISGNQSDQANSNIVSSSNN